MFVLFRTARKNEEKNYLGFIFGHDDVEILSKGREKLKIFKIGGNFPGLFVCVLN